MTIEQDRNINLEASASLSGSTAHVPGFDPKDEPLPFVSNFQDIFLTIGVVISLIGAGMFTFSATNDLESSTLATAINSGVLILLAFVLSQVLVGKRRRILPGIILSLVFTVCAVILGGVAYEQAFGDQFFERLDNIGYEIEDAIAAVDEPTHENLRAATTAVRDAMPPAFLGALVALPALGLLASFFYYRRFKLPFAISLTGQALVLTVVAGLFIVFPYDLVRFSPSVYFASGLMLLIAAISYDMRDPERVSRFSGNGFWLHFAAAPIVLFGALFIAEVGPVLQLPDLVNGDVSSLDGGFSITQSVITLGIISLFALLSLLLNRRALVVAGLVSAGTAIGVIVNATGLGAAEVAAVTLMVLGGGIVLLGIGWHAARRALLTFVPSGGFWGRMFPRNEADG